MKTKTDPLMAKIEADLALARAAIQREAFAEIIVSGELDCPVCRRGRITWRRKSRAKFAARCTGITCVNFED